VPATHGSGSGRSVGHAVWSQTQPLCAGSQVQLQSLYVQTCPVQVGSGVKSGALGGQPPGAASGGPAAASTVPDVIGASTGGALVWLEQAATANSNKRRRVMGWSR
jgi:hypothetical protein